jgi:hypothetical protein
VLQGGDAGPEGEEHQVGAAENKGEEQYRAGAKEAGAQGADIRLQYQPSDRCVHDW